MTALSCLGSMSKRSFRLHLMVLAATMVVVVSGPGSTAPQSDGVWEVPPPPPGRQQHTATYDPIRNRVVLIGGWTGAAQSDTWLLSLDPSASWSRLLPGGTAPPGLVSHSAMFEPAGDYIIVFGGVQGGSLSNKTWVLTMDSPAWSGFPTSGPKPSPRRDHAVIHDTVRNRMLVIGGVSGLSPTNDVWELTLDGLPEWSELQPAGPLPPARTGHGCVYDAAADRVIMFGGYDGSAYLNDAWELDLSGAPTWSELDPAGPLPTARSRHRVVFDAAQDRMLLFGGYDGATQSNETWELALGASPAWTQLSPAGGIPAPRSNHAFVHDPQQDRLIVFGGFDGLHERNDTWSLEGGAALAWIPVLGADGPPLGRYGHAAIYDPIRERMILYGGRLPGANPVSETWILSLDENAGWTKLSPSGPVPPARWGHSAIYDPVRDEMVVFGGQTTPIVYFDDAWTLSLGANPSWTELAPSGSAPMRSEHTAIYDPGADRMIVFGGNSADTWALTLGANPAWQTLSASGPLPTPRFDHTAIYEPAGDRMILFGGMSFSGTVLEDTWALSLDGGGSWAQLTPAGTAPGRRRHSAIYDPVRSRMIVYAGRVAGYLDDAWALSLSGLPAWSLLSPGGTVPAERTDHTAIYDGARDRMVVFGGITPEGSLNDVHSLVWETATGVPNPSPPTLAASIGAALHPNPFRDETTLRFRLSRPEHARVQVFDVSGRAIRTLWDGMLPAGAGEARWNGRDGSDRNVAPGVYLLRVKVGDLTEARRVTLIR